MFTAPRSIARLRAGRGLRSKLEKAALRRGWIAYRSIGDELLRTASAGRRIPIELKNGARVKANDVAPQGVYRPNYNILTPNMRSPEYVQMSTAAALTLGIMSGKMYRCECTRCLNLLLTYPEAAARTAPIAGLRAIARPSATTRTATSSASTGRRCRST